MKIEITLPDEYQGMIDVVVADTKKQNPERSDVAIGSIMAQQCRQFIIELHAGIMGALPAPEDLEEQ